MGGGGGADDMYSPTLLPQLPQFPNLPPSFMQLQLQHLQNQFGHQPPPSHPKIAQVPPFRLLEEPRPPPTASAAKLMHKLGEAANGNSAGGHHHHPHHRQLQRSPTFAEEQLQQLKCDKCEFATSAKDVFRNHLMLHASTERGGALHQLLTSPLHHQQQQQYGGQKRPYSAASSSSAELNRSGEDFSAYSPKMRSGSPAAASSPRSPFGGRNAAVMMEKAESPLSHPHLSYLNRLALSAAANNPLLQGLGSAANHAAIRALMEERCKEASPPFGSMSADGHMEMPSGDPRAASATPLEMQQQQRIQGSANREEAPLPPNKRLKSSDIFSALYASRMRAGEMMREKAESPNGAALDLSKETTVVLGGSHGSSLSDMESGSNPRSHSSSPACSSSASQPRSRNRRKGKAYKIEQRTDHDSEEEEGAGGATGSSCSTGTGSPLAAPPPPAAVLPGSKPDTSGGKCSGPTVDRSSAPQEAASPVLGQSANAAACKFCGIAFQNSVMYSVHMGYHGFEDPFKCSLCGEEAVDALTFFLHIARREHQ